jgi:hypothetical protein
VVGVVVGGVVVVVDFEGVVLVAGSEVLDLDPEVLVDDPVVLFEAVLEALGAVGVVPAGVVKIGTC